jgi:hypothetical protein
MTRMFLSVPSVSSVVIVLERSGKAGRQCSIASELAGDFVVYERFFAEPADRANDEERGQVVVSIGRRGRAPRHGSSWSLDSMNKSHALRLVATGLALLGAVECFYGFLWGRLRIYSHEAPFYRAIAQPGPEQNRAFNHYIDLFQDQWHVVAWFGLVSIAFAAALFWIGSASQKVQPSAPPNSRPPSQLPASPEVQAFDSQRTPPSGGCG